jgi:hypothetical protein
MTPQPKTKLASQPPVSSNDTEDLDDIIFPSDEVEEEGEEEEVEPVKPVKKLVLKEGQLYTVQVRGFNFIRDYVSLDGIIGGYEISGIVGKRSEWSFQDLLATKNVKVKLMFKEVGYSSSGTEYNRFQFRGFAH